MSAKATTGHIVEPALEGFAVYDETSPKTRVARDVMEVASIVGAGSSVLVAIPRRWVFLRVLRVPDVSKSEVRQVVGLQLEQLLPVSQSEVAFDLHLTRDVTSEGRLAVVYAVQEKHLDQLRSQLASAGLEPSQALPACLGSALIAESLELEKCLVVSAVAGGIAFDVVMNGEVVYTRESAVTPSDQTLSIEISQTLAAAEVDHLPIVFAGELRSPLGDYTFDQAPGALLGAVQSSRAAVHLESPRVVQAREMKKRSTRVRLTALLCAVALLMWVAVGLRNSETEAAAAKVRARQEADLRTLRSKLASVQSQTQEQAKLVDTLERAFNAAQPMGDVLTVVTNHVTEGMWLTNFSIERGKPMLVRGTATSNESVSQFITSLTSDPRFRDVRLLFANNAAIEATPVVQFSAQAHAVGNVPISETTRAAR